MELKTFIQRALAEIVLGAAAAHDEIKATGGSALPEVTSEGAKALGMSFGFKNYAPITTVSFDVAVTTESAEGGKAGIGILAGWFGAGVQGETKQTSGAASRLKFDLPLQLPCAPGAGTKEQASGSSTKLTRG